VTTVSSAGVCTPKAMAFVLVLWMEKSLL